MNIDLFIAAKGDCQIILPDGGVVREYTQIARGVPDFCPQIKHILHNSVIIEDGIEVDMSVRHLREGIQSLPTYIYERETRDYIISVHVSMY